MRAAKHFLEQLEAAEESAVAAAAKARTKGWWAASVLYGAPLERQSLSQAVQIFAAMAVESGLNLYLVLAYGDEVFRRDLERSTIKVKLKEVLGLVREAPIAPDSEIEELVFKLADARNAFMHPKPREMTGSSSPEAAAPRSDLPSARQAIEDATRCLQLLGTRDREYYPFLLTF